MKLDDVPVCFCVSMGTSTAVLSETMQSICLSLVRAVLLYLLLLASPDDHMMIT